MIKLCFSGCKKCQALRYTVSPGAMLLAGSGCKKCQALRYAVALSDAGGSGEDYLRMLALCGGCLTAPAPAPVRGGVLRKPGLGLLVSYAQLSTGNPQLIHRILIHRARRAACLAARATQAGAWFALDGWRGVVLAVVVMLRPRRLGGSVSQARWGGLKVRPPKICAPPRKIVGGWRKKLRRLDDDFFKAPR